MEYSRKNILTMTFLMEGIALILALFSAEYFEITLSLSSDNFIRDLLTGTGGAILPLIFFLFLISERAKKIALISSLRKIVTTDIKAIFSHLKLVDIFIISLIAGISEEMLFRGVIQMKFGIVIASIVFGLMHCVSAAYAIVAVLMGFYIGAFYYFTENLLVPVQIHFIYDLGALIFLRYYVKGKKT